MKPILQTVIDEGIGNCMQAAVASMLEVQLSDIPNFMDYADKKDPSKWHLKFMDVMESYGYEFEGSKMIADSKSETYFDLGKEMMINDCIYASVKSRNFEGTGHAVLLDSKGVVIHDPHPEQAFMGVDVVATDELNYWQMFSLIPMEAQKNPEA